MEDTRKSACMAIYRREIPVSGVSENISAETVVNLRRSISAVISVLLVNTKNQNYKLRHQHL